MRGEQLLSLRFAALRVTRYALQLRRYAAAGAGSSRSAAAASSSEASAASNAASLAERIGYKAPPARAPPPPTPPQLKPTPATSPAELFARLIAAPPGPSSAPLRTSFTPPPTVTPRAAVKSAASGSAGGSLLERLGLDLNALAPKPAAQQRRLPNNREPRMSPAGARIQAEIDAKTAGAGEAERTRVGPRGGPTPARDAPPRRYHPLRDVIEAAATASQQQAVAAAAEAAAVALAAKKRKQAGSKLGSWREDDDDDDTGRRRKQRRQDDGLPDKGAAKVVVAPPPPVVRSPTDVLVPELVTVRELARLLSCSRSSLAATLEALGESSGADAAVGREAAELAAAEFHCRLSFKSAANIRGIAAGVAGPMARPRPPVVTIMGHVDHGKTTLLDALRNTRVAAGEAGGITQHVGAFVVQLPGAGALTFLDTPGHAAFSAMRARGAALTDLVVLVVAADEGVMPQTREALAHARAAACPIVVALTKCDRAVADPARVRQQLLAEDMELEDAGGNVPVVHVSALQRMGLDELVAALLLQAEALDLRAPWEVDATAVVVESCLDKSLGPKATLIVQRGVLRAGDHVVVGAAYGAIRQLKDTTGGFVEEATPSMPVEAYGFKGLPAAGDVLVVVSSEARARQVADRRQRSAALLADINAIANQMPASPAVSLFPTDGPRGAIRGWRAHAAKKASVAADNLVVAAGEKARNAVETAVLLKADVDGTAAALHQAVLNLHSAAMPIKILACGVGPITPSDVATAAASGAAILGFNVAVEGSMAEAAARHAGVPLLTHAVIYHLLDDLGALLVAKLPHTAEHTVAGEATILAVFPIKSKRGTPTQFVAGCRVLEGRLRRGDSMRLLRDGKILHEAECASLRRDKLVVEQVGTGVECGVQLDGFGAFLVGDVFQCMTTIMRPPVTVPVPGGGLRVVEAGPR